MPDIFTTSKTSTKLNSSNTYQHISAKPGTDLNTAKQGIGLLPELKTAVPGIFSALVHLPVGFTFVHQEKDEQIILFTRRHFITNFVWIAIAFIALLIPPLFPFFLQLLNLPAFSPPLSLTIILLLFYYLLILGFVLYNFVDWFYNIGIITEKRIIDIDFLRLSYIDIAIAQLTDVEDVIHKQKGFFSSFFDYGDVIAHTVSNREDFEFEKIPYPARVVDIISKLIKG